MTQYKTPTSLPDIWASFVRTAVPVTVGASLASSVGEFILADAATEFVAAFLSLVYYAGVRLLERRFGDRAGWLLGFPKQPVYVSLPSADGEDA